MMLGGQSSAAPTEETGMAGLEGKQEAEPISPGAGDRLLDVFVGEGMVHWLRTSCKHRASKDHRGSQQVSQSWMSHVSFHEFACSPSVKGEKCVRVRATPLPTPSCR